MTLGIQAKGYKKVIRMGYEASYGSAPASGDYYHMPFNDEGIGSSEESIESTVMDGNRYRAEPSFGKIAVAGNITVPLDVRNIGFWLKLLFGEPSTSGSGTYTHVFDPTEDLISATIEKGYPDISAFHRFHGLKANSASFQFVVGQEMTTSFELIGKNEDAPATSSIDASAPEKVVSMFQAKGISVEKGGVAANAIAELNINIRNDVFGDNYLLGGNGFRANCPETSFAVDGSFSMLFDSNEGKATYLEAQNTTETSLKITMTSGSHSLAFEMQEVKFPRQPPESSAANPVRLVQPFGAYYQDGAYGVPIRATLINDVASY